MEKDLDRELRYHLDRRIQDLLKSGLTAADARNRAAIEFGGFVQVQEDVRDTWLVRWLYDVVRDLRYACRGLSRSPGFTAVVMLTLALGIGANTAIFSLVEALMLRALPVQQPEELALLKLKHPNGSTAGDFSYPFFELLRNRNQ